MLINQLTLVKQNSPRRKSIGGVTITDKKSRAKNDELPGYFYLYCTANGKRSLALSLSRSVSFSLSFWWEEQAEAPTAFIG